MRTDWSGYSYTTDKTTIRVISKSGKVKAGGKYLYNVVCDMCSKDKELWPNGLLFPAAVIRKHTVSCGCGKNPKWSKQQFEILVSRACAKNGMVFLGFVGEFTGNKTKVKILDVTTGDTWETQTINKVLSRGANNPYLFCKTDDEFIQEIKLSGNYKEGTIFYKENNVWWYECPVCSKDKLVKAGLCSGKFRTARNRLRRGAKSCRCSDVYKPTQCQVNFIISEVIGNRGKLLSTGNWYKNNRSSFEYLCYGCDSTQKSNYHDIKAGRFCRNCCKTGYSSSKGGRLYLVRWFNEEHDFLKFGITNLTLKERTRRQSLKSGLNYEVVLDLYFKDGKIPEEIENSIKSYFCTGYANKNIFPDGFTETLCVTQMENVINYILNKIPTLEV